MEISLHYFIVTNNDGLFLKGRFNGYEKSWTNNIKEAKLFLKKKQAITQISFWTRIYPQKGLPILIPIDIQYDYNSISYGKEINIEAKVSKVNERILQSKLKRK